MINQAGQGLQSVYLLSSSHRFLRVNRCLFSYPQPRIEKFHGHYRGTRAPAVSLVLASSAGDAR